MSTGPINSTISGGTLSLQNSKTNSAKVDSGQKSEQTAPTTKQDSVSTEQIQGSSTVLNNILDGISQSLQTIESAQGSVSNILGLLREGIQIAAQASENIAPPDLAALSALRGRFNALLTEINGIVDDAGTRGINLLKGADLETTFGAHARNNITTKGVDVSTQELGVDDATFSSAEAIGSTVQQLQSAIAQLELFNKDLSEDYSKIKTRQNFAEESLGTIDNAQDDIATDEGANLLALKIGQQLAQLAESTLASRDQQDLLRLF